jgi:hypothetical protein
MKSKLFVLFNVVIISALLFTACAPAVTPTAAPQPAAPAAPAATEAPSQPAVAPTAAPAQPTKAGEAPIPPFNGKGAWLDKVVFSAVADPEPAVAQLQANTIDLYSATIDKADVFAKVKADPNLVSANTYGSSNQLLLNTTVCTDKTILNPFTDMKIREAMNWAVDRNYVVQEIFGGLAKPKFTAFTTAFPDYARYADLFSAVETKYAYNFDKAKAVVDAEMPILGATKGPDGKWQFSGKPVTIIGLIRTEDKRKEIGEYFANQLEKLGFTVDRQEKVRKEASPIWQGEPAPCKFNYYTAGWISPQIYRDEGLNFDQYNTGKLQNLPVMNNYQPSTDLLAAGDALYTNSFKTMDDRRSLYQKALTLSMAESWWGVWINDSIAFEVSSNKTQGASDLAAGFLAQLYPYTARFAGKEGGTLRIANSAILVDAWNPIAGSNWVDDSIPRNFTTDYGVIYNPYTGLLMPKLVTKAEVVAQDGLPIAQPQSNWVSLNFQKSVAVPDDAWVDWDASTQKFITAGEAVKAKAIMDQVLKQATDSADKLAVAKFDDKALVQYISDLAAFYAKTANTKLDLATVLAAKDTIDNIAGEIKTIGALKTDADKKKEITSFAQTFIGGQVADNIWSLGQRDYSTAKTKVTVTYTPDLWKTTWSDGSNMSPADFVFYMIMTFDPGKKASKIYDPSLGSSVDTYLTHFKGVKIVSTDPLTIETYDDTFALDAENNVKDWYPNIYGPTAFAGGMIAWHNLTPALQAEADGKMALSKDKSTNNKVDYTSQVSGPTLDVQMKYVADDLANKYIPFAATMSNYIKPDDAVARYNNLTAFYAAHKHIVLGTGPYMVDQVFPVEGSITVVRNGNYLFPADQFAGFDEPKLMTLAVDGPTTLAAGDEGSFDITINFKDQPYPAKDIDKVAYTLFNANGDIVATGAADAVADGQYKVTLGKDVTGKLTAGTSKLTVAAASKVVSLPVFETAQFVVTK